MVVLGSGGGAQSQGPRSPHPLKVLTVTATASRSVFAPTTWLSLHSPDLSSANSLSAPFPCCAPGGSHMQPTLRATLHLLGGGIYKYRLFGILNGCSPILPHSLLYSITYMYHYRLMTIYFITWVITQYDFMLLLQWVQLWPRELCWLTPVCLWLPHHVGGGALPYFLELQGAPASSGAAPASALESDSSPGILVAPGGGIRHLIWCCVCLWLWDVQLLASPR